MGTCVCAALAATLILFPPSLVLRGAAVRGLHGAPPCCTNGASRAYTPPNNMKSASAGFPQLPPLLFHVCECPARLRQQHDNCVTLVAPHRTTSGNGFDRHRVADKLTRPGTSFGTTALAVSRILGGGSVFLPSLRPAARALSSTSNLRAIDRRRDSVTLPGIERAFCCVAVGAGSPRLE